ncbi:MAG TPA: hypothetical protein VFX52_05240 [Nocardioidaceae bacterium]|jgi:hypothetical protein|nr:hypothetical protein [Nocardioidaceae bacterium]
MPVPQQREAKAYETPAPVRIDLPDDGAPVRIDTDSLADAVDADRSARRDLVLHALEMARRTRRRSASARLSRFA